MQRSDAAKSLTNPATYLYAALRAFVSSAYSRVSGVLDGPYVFNFGPGTPYPDLPTLRKKLAEAVEYWRDRNAFVAELIGTTLERSAKTDESRVVHDIFLPLTNYFFCYIKVDRRQSKAVSTVRVLFPVDFDCKECPLKENARALCANSCFRFAFFPYKPEEMVNQYDGHYRAAQFALADASYAAAIPDLNGGNAPEVPLAALMVPLLFGEPLLLTDAAAAKEEYRLPVKNRVLATRCRFGKMNEDLGIRSEAFLPIKVDRPFMPSFYAGSRSANPPDDASPQEWVPDFPHSSPFCIELYSPMPDWFAHAPEEDVDHAPGHHKYVFQNSASDTPQYRDRPPIPRIFSLPRDGGRDDGLSAVWTEIGKVLALGFNLQHYSELMAGAFVDWLRAIFTDSAFDPFTPTLRRRYKEFLRGESKPMPPEVEEFLNFVRNNPDLLADVLNEIQHGMLLQPNFAPAATYDLSSLAGIRHLAKEVDAAAVVEELDYEQLPYCEAPQLGAEEFTEGLKTSNKSGVLSRLVAEVIKNHKREGQENAIRFHVCLDPDQHRYSLHFCSPGVEVDLTTYLNLRQGLPHLRQESTQRAYGLRRSGIGLALSRVIAEEEGLEYVLGLGRDEKHTPSQAELEVRRYRRDLHTRIYFGGSL